MPARSRPYRSGSGARVPWLLILALAAAAIGCESGPASSAGGVSGELVPVEDLTRDLVRAERRAAGDPDVAIRMGLAGPAGDRRLALIADAPARITWRRRLPERAAIVTAVWLESGAGAIARVGIADDRTYEVLARVELHEHGVRAWQPLVVDLGGYAGWQWSLFYRPGDTEWRLVFSVDASPGGTIAWGGVEIRKRP
ncbi:MAG: hypothetical protein R2752_05285 [Vicinamibacterales bacterium]